MAEMSLASWWAASGVFSWLILGGIFLVLELLSMGLTTIWFAGGALAAFLVGLLGGGLVLQIIVFFAVSIILLALTRPIAVKYLNNTRVKTNAGSLIGENGVVKEEIHNLNATGLITVNGVDWSARGKEPHDVIAAGSVVRILEIQGVKLIVEPVVEQTNK